MANDRLMLIGCGILKKEIRCLIEKNGWPLETCFLDSALHINFENLAGQLTATLDRHRERDRIVFYGACHPLMDRLLEKGRAIRTPGQNCVDILLGHPLFMEELQKGAFFLMEDWARRWEEVVHLTIGHNLSLIRELYQGSHTHLLCIRTPCSGDFNQEAEEAGRLVGLPLQWRDVSLDHLEDVLLNTMAAELREKERG